jgi:hypothetical protein
MFRWKRNNPAVEKEIILKDVIGFKRGLISMASF